MIRLLNLANLLLPHQLKLPQVYHAELQQPARFAIDPEDLSEEAMKSLSDALKKTGI